MDALVIIGVVAVALLILAVIQMIRFMLKFWRDEIEMEPGGSYGKQLRRDKRC